MSRLSWAIAAFSVAFAAVHVLPLWAGKPFSPFPLITTGSVLDLLSPLVMVPLYWLLYRWDRPERSSQSPRWPSIAFLLLAALWVEGHSIHLSANAISLVLKGARVGGDAYTVTNFYDEDLGHYLWHFGMVGLSALIMHQQWRRPVAGAAQLPAVEVAAGCVYGLIFFGTVIEGGTWPLGLPFSVLVTAFGAIWGWRRFGRQPLLVFFIVGYLVATVCFVGWGAYWGGLPQFSDVGIID